MKLTADQFDESHVMRDADRLPPLEDDTPAISLTNDGGSHVAYDSQDGYRLDNSQSEQRQESESTESWSDNDQQLPAIKVDDERPSPVGHLPRIRTSGTSRDAPSRQSTPRREPKRLLFELAKVVAGGFAGLVLAQLLLWWLPGNPRRDPFHLADRLPSQLHWILPEDLQSAPSQREQDTVWQSPPGTPLGPLLNQSD